MQILQGAGDLAGARGWLWRVERVERAGSRATIAWLARAAEHRTQALTVVQPAEPMSHTAGSGAPRPVPVAAALEAVRRAHALERRAFGVAAAARLAGEIHAWQLAPALAFARGHARVLLADPVGMGKTVSSALALAECLSEGPDRRCLVIAPGHLLAQWREELRRRVSIDAEIADAASLRRLERGLPAGMPAWARAGCLIASIDFIKQPHVARALEPLAWDMLVVDEAHAACGQSERHAACEMLARRARRLLLVTATPSDGGSERGAALARLGGAGEALVRLRHETPAARLLRDRTLTVRAAPSAALLHRALASYARWIAEGPRGDPGIALVGSLLAKRALSSAHAAHISLARRLALIACAPQPARQPSLFEAEDGDEDDAAVLGARSGRAGEEERRRLEILTRLAARAARHDRRLDALARLVRRAREPVAIFTCFRDTALLIARRLSPHADTRVVHGALPAACASAAIAAFTRGPAQVLVATDVASQGLNLHARCRWVIHYDLPWRPSTLRQRSGRVDRLGQAKRAHATALVDRTPLARGLTARTAALGARMRDDDFATPRRWRVMAAAEAARAIARRREPSAHAAHAPRGWPATVIQISLASASGEILDRSALAIAADEGDAGACGAKLAARIAATTRGALLARAARRVARERAVAAAALETIASTRVQRGLFDHRADRVQTAQARARADTAIERRARIARHLALRRVASARVEVVAVFRKDAPTP